MRLEAEGTFGCRNASSAFVVRMPGVGGGNVFDIFPVWCLSLHIYSCKIIHFMFPIVHRMIFRKPSLASQKVKRNDLVALSLSLLVFSLVGNNAGAIVGLHTLDDQEYRDFGAQFPSVGKLSTNGTIRGSGSLISEAGGGSSNWVLTAAHLATPNEFTVNGTIFSVVEFIRHPDYNSSTLANDVALARLSTSVSGQSPLSWHGNDNDVGAGLQVVSVGVGRSGDGQTGESGPAGTLRAAQNTISAKGTNSPITPGPTFMEYIFHDPSHSSVRPLEGMAVLYDSGGPVVADFGSGYTIVGVHSYVINNGGARGTYGDITGSTRVTLYDDWITSVVPEPTVWGLFAGLAALSGAIFKRRR